MRAAKWTSPAGTFAAVPIVWMLLGLVGCATSEPIALQVQAPPDQPTARFNRPIAFMHARSFREHQDKIEPYGRGYVLTLKTGEASDEALRQVYPRLFSNASEVVSRDDLTGLAGPDAPEALLEPSFVELRYLNASRRMQGPYFAEVVYRFTLTEPQGGPIATWFVRGFGQYSPDLESRVHVKDSQPVPTSEQSWSAEAPRRAIEAAVASFVGNVERVPELSRWRQGQPVSSTDVAIDQQGMRTPDGGGAGVEAHYADALMLRVERAPLPGPPDVSAQNSGDEPGLLAVRLTLANMSSHRLALDPADIEWNVGPNSTHEPLPAPIAAALITRMPLGLAVATGTGMAALPSVFAALASAAESERHRTELTTWVAKVSGEVLVDGVVPGGQSRTGLIYFALPDKPIAGRMTVPIIDLDQALRYTVRLPFPKP